MQKMEIKFGSSVDSQTLYCLLFIKPKNPNLEQQRMEKEFDDKVITIAGNLDGVIMAH